MTCLVHPTPNYVITYRFYQAFPHVSTTSNKCLFQKVWGYMPRRHGNHSVFCYLLLLTSGNSTYPLSADVVAGHVLLILTEVISLLILVLLIVYSAVISHDELGWLVCMYQYCS